MTRDELLGRLQPPALPVDPGHWPPALAWWILLAIALLIVLILFAWRYDRKRNRHYHRAKESLSQISHAYQRHGDARQLLQQLAYWLRQVVKLQRPDNGNLTLHGEAWLVFLDSSLPQPAFSHGTGRIFAEQIYQANPQYDCDEAIALCYRWLAANQKQLKQHDPV